MKDTVIAILASVDIQALGKGGLEWDGERCVLLCSWWGGGGVARTLFIAARFDQGHSAWRCCKCRGWLSDVDVIEKKWGAGFTRRSKVDLNRSSPRRYRFSEGTG